MKKISKENQSKLHEVILEKTMASINGSKEETKKTPKTAKAKAEPKAKASKKAEPKKKETAKSTRSGDSKYIYPADCTDALSKKKFRANARATIATYEKKLSALKEGSKEYKATAKEFKEYKATILSNQ